MDFAGKQTGRTGLYFDASCDGGGGNILAALNLLSTGSGTWTNAGAPCGGSVSLIASEPSFATLTTASLQGWGCSVHETWPTFKTDWSALAVATDTATKPTCGVDPNTGLSACGQAYILIAGSSIVVVSGSIAITPLDDTNPVGTTHTVTATVTSGGSPLAGQLVTFTVTGQNAGAVGVCVPADCKSDANGEVTFTYMDTNGAGDDTIKASFTDAAGSLQAATAQKHWVGDPPRPSLSIVKSITAGDPYSAVSDVISYSYVVTNTGNVTITSVSVTDDKAGTATCPATAASMAPGDSVTCTASYAVTQVDLDAGSVTNVATAHGTPAGGTLIEPTDTQTAHATQSPALSIVKSITAGDPYSAVGDVISYSYLVTNTGNVTITGVSVTDDKAGAATCLTTSLAPTASTTCTATYAVTQADLDAGSVTNVATAHGTPAGGTLIEPTDRKTARAIQKPSVTINKTTNGSDGSFILAGTAITWKYKVTNTGNVTLTNVTVTDNQLPATAINCGSGSNVIASLAPSASVTCAATGTATVGAYANTGTVTATPPSGSNVSASDGSSYTGYAFAPGGGAFVVGDKTAIGSVTFWGAQWWKVNSLSGGAAPSAFKGFAKFPAAPACGIGWNTDPGNSAPPPAGPLPAYMAVIVSSNITKSGSQISGNTLHIVIVKTDAGYDSNPGHAGTGTVVATIC